MPGLRESQTVCFLLMKCYTLEYKQMETPPKIITDPSHPLRGRDSSLRTTALVKMVMAKAKAFATMLAVETSASLRPQKKTADPTRFNP